MDNTRPTLAHRGQRHGVPAAAASAPTVKQHARSGGTTPEVHAKPPAPGRSRKRIGSRAAATVQPSGVDSPSVRSWPPKRWSAWRQESCLALQCSGSWVSSARHFGRPRSCWRIHHAWRTDVEEPGGMRVVHARCRDARSLSHCAFRLASLEARPCASALFGRLVCATATETFNPAPESVTALLGRRRRSSRERGFGVAARGVRTARRRRKSRA